MLLGFTIALQVGTRGICHLQNGVTLIPSL